MPYVGRFAPSPTGPLHAGSLVAALASWLDARAHQGRWLVRLEDVDLPRCVAGADEQILQQLAQCGLLPDAPVCRQSQRGALYQQALDRLIQAGLAYPCSCSRSQIASAQAARGRLRQRGHALPYPGTCRPTHASPARPPSSAVAWRLHGPRAAALPPNGPLRWQDRRLGTAPAALNPDEADLVLRRADQLWTYPLAVVVDDADQGVTDVVRGQDLAEQTPQQILLQAALLLPRPRYLHTPLVLAADGEKLSKQNGAAALDLASPLAALGQAAQALQLPPASNPASLSEALAFWTEAWRQRFVLPNQASPNPASSAQADAV